MGGVSLWEASVLVPPADVCVAGGSALHSWSAGAWHVSR